MRCCVECRAECLYEDKFCNACGALLPDGAMVKRLQGAFTTSLVATIISAIIVIWLWRMIM